MLCRELLCRCSCIICACWPSFTATNTAAVQAHLLVKCCCWMGTKFWTVATLSACLSSLCLSMLHLCWLCASLAAIPTGMVSHYQPCLLVLCLNIGRACLCGVSLNAMHSSCGQPWPAAYINFNRNKHQIRVLTKPLCRAQAIFYSLPNNEWGTKYRGLTYSVKLTVREICRATYSARQARLQI